LVTTRLDARIVAGRVVHGAVAIAFLVSIGIVWWAALSAEATAATAVAIGLLAGEGLLVLRAGGRCPLECVWRALGDETPFFELVLGPRLAPHAIPVLAAVTIIGVFGVAVRLMVG
jgi:hypothetical protein